MNSALGKKALEIVITGIIGMLLAFLQAYLASLGDGTIPSASPETAGGIALALKGLKEVVTFKV